MIASSPLLVANSVGTDKLMFVSSCCSGPSAVGKDVGTHKVFVGSVVTPIITSSAGDRFVIHTDSGGSARGIGGTLVVVGPSTCC